MSQKDYEKLPLVLYFDKNGRLIPGHPGLPPEARAQLPFWYILRKKSKQQPVDEQAGDIPWYPQTQWETTPTIDEDDSSHILRITTRVPKARLYTTKPDPTLGEKPAVCQEQANVLRTVGIELH